MNRTQAARTGEALSTSGFLKSTELQPSPSDHLHLQRCDLLLVGCGGQKIVHLTLQQVLHLHVDVVARRFLLIGGIHAAHRTSQLGH